MIGDYSKCYAFFVIACLVFFFYNFTYGFNGSTKDIGVVIALLIL